MSDSLNGCMGATVQAPVLRNLRRMRISEDIHVGLPLSQFPNEATAPRVVKVPSSRLQRFEKCGTKPFDKTEGRTPRSETNPILEGGGSPERLQPSLFIMIVPNEPISARSSSSRLNGSR